MSTASDGPVSVAFVHDTNEFGGLEIVLLRLMAGLDREAYAPVLVVPDTDDAHSASPGPLIERTRQLDVPIAHFPRPPGRVTGRVRELVGLARLFADREVDVVHIHTARVEGARKSTIAARLGRVPVVMRTEHSPPAAFSNPDGSSALRRSADRLTDLIMTVSEYDRREQIDTVGRDADKVRCLHNGVDIERFAPDVVDGDEVARSISGDGPIIGGLGRFSPEKGFEFLVRAIGKLHDEGIAARLVLVGSGPLEAGLRSLADDLGLADRVTFAGQQLDPRPFIAAMDVAAMPSLHEGFPLTLLEFMAMERPTVVTDHPGILEATIAGDTSVVVGRGDVDGLADGIRSLLDDPGRRARMGEAARRHVVDNFSLQHYVTSTQAIYDVLLDEHGRR